MFFVQLATWFVVNCISIFTPLGVVMGLVNSDFSSKSCSQSAECLIGCHALKTGSVIKILLHDDIVILRAARLIPIPFYGA